MRMKTNETLQSNTNATILSRLLALLEATTHPYVILGDWQNNPGHFPSTVLPAKFHFSILAPDHSVLSGNVLDYGLVRNTLAGTTALTTDWAIPWRPHALLDIEAVSQEYRQIQYFPTLPATPDIDFWPCATYQSQAFELELYGNPPNDSAQAWADWISCAEQYLLQEHPWAAQGRGASLHTVTKPLVPSPPPPGRKAQASLLGAAHRQVPMCAQPPGPTARGTNQRLRAGHPGCASQLDGATNMGISRHMPPLAPIP